MRIEIAPEIEQVSRPQANGVPVDAVIENT